MNSLMFAIKSQSNLKNKYSPVQQNMYENINPGILFY